MNRSITSMIIAVALLCLAGHSSASEFDRVAVFNPAKPTKLETIMRSLHVKNMTFAQADPACGLCTKDDDCGSGHKCCQSNCPSDKKKCLYVTTCP